MSSLISNDGLTLADLPSDIIRNIITLDSIDDLRMISPHWNAVVNGFLKERKRLPVINEISWNVCREYYYPIITISRSNSKYFRIDNFYHDLTSNEGKEGTYGKKFRRDTGFGQLKHSLTKLFVRCSSVERIIIDNLEGLHVLKVILRDVVVTTMEFRGLGRIGNEHRRIIENLVKTNSIQYLHLYFNSHTSALWEMYKQDHFAFMKMCSTLDSTVELHFSLSGTEIMSIAVARNCWYTRANDWSRNGNFLLNLTFNRDTVDMVVTPKVRA